MYRECSQERAIVLVSQEPLADIVLGKHLDVKVSKHHRWFFPATQCEAAAKHCQFAIYCRVCGEIAAVTRLGFPELPVLLDILGPQVGYPDFAKRRYEVLLDFDLDRKRVVKGQIGDI